jgi:hypothetical protein
MTMSDVLRRVALVHATRIEKENKTRELTARKKDARVICFNDTGIPAMWEDIKHLRIPNPAPREVAGLTVTFEDLLVPYDVDTGEGCGITFYGRRGVELSWYVADVSNNDAESPILRYCHSGSRKAFNRCISDANAKKAFIDTFVRGLARYITAPMLAEMNIDMTPPPNTKATRKFLQVAAAE